MLTMTHYALSACTIPRFLTYVSITSNKSSSLFVLCGNPNKALIFRIQSEDFLEAVSYRLRATQRMVWQKSSVPAGAASAPPRCRAPRRSAGTGAGRSPGTSRTCRPRPLTTGGGQDTLRTLGSAPHFRDLYGCRFLPCNL